MWRLKFTREALEILNDKMQQIIEMGLFLPTIFVLLLVVSCEASIGDINPDHRWDKSFSYNLTVTEKF